jgi:hypothetical protein
LVFYRLAQKYYVGHTTLGDDLYHAEFKMDPVLEQKLEKIRSSPKLQSQQEVCLTC